MITRVMCGWCHEFTRRRPGEPAWCAKCGHEAGVPRLFCRCRVCAEMRAHGDETRVQVLKDEPGRN